MKISFSLKNQNNRQKISITIVAKFSFTERTVFTTITVKLITKKFKTETSPKNVYFQA